MRKKYEYKLPDLSGLAKEEAAIYSSGGVHSISPSWDVFLNVIKDEPQSEILNFISKAKSVGVNKNIYAELLAVNLRTLNRYIAGSSSLDYDKIEKAIRLNNLFINGISVFGNKEVFGTWLLEHNTYLNEKPISFLSVISGIEIVENLLGKIDHGIIG